MKPVFQVHLDGECVRCSIASLLELPKEKLPSFNCEGHVYDTELKLFICTIPEHKASYGTPTSPRFTCDGNDDQRRRINQWAAQFGLVFTDMWMGYGAREGGGPRGGKDIPPGLCAASGSSPRGSFNHMVVWDTRLRDYEHPLGRMVHDPNPDPEGKRPGFSGAVEHLSFFEVVDPALLYKLAALKEGT